MAGWFILFKMSVTHPFFAMKIAKLLVNGKITALSQVNFVTQSLHQTLQTTLVNFENLLG